VPLVLVPRGIVALAIVRRHLGFLGVGVVKLALGPWHLVLGADVVRARSRSWNPLPWNGF
jgi:hypothetical protein